MAEVTRDSLKKRLFSDPKNYPYGFSRSGDFSISESRALGQEGAFIAALVDGHITPENDDEQAILEAALGAREASTPALRAWVKYQSRINRPKTASIYGSKQAASVEDDDDSIVADDSDIEIEIDNA